MSIILSLQGCMAAGKTTAARYVEQRLPQVHVSYENPAPMIEEIRRRNLKQNTPEGFVEIQKLFIRAEIARREENRKHEFALLDLGPEEIAFFTLHYPKSMGFDWDVQSLLRDELEALWGCMSDRVLFIDTGAEQLRRNKENDATRNRGFFDHTIEYLLPMKKDWLFAQDRFPVDVLDAGRLDKLALQEAVLRWVALRIGASCPVR